MFNESHAGGTSLRYFANRCRAIFGRARLLKSCLAGRLVPARGRVDSLSEAAFGISVVILLANGASSPVLAGEAGCDELLPAQVFRNVQEKYASLTIYSDDGCVAIASRDGNSIINFTTRLARPNYYLIEWRRSSEATSYPWIASPEAVWSSSVHNLLLLTKCAVRKEYNREIALAHAAAPSGGATATIPQMFFNGQWADQGEPFDKVVLSEKRQADETVGNISCYVFTWGFEGRTNSLWIGKQDFLIHQARTTISPGAIRAAAANLVKDAEQIRALPGFTFTELHTHIVLNQQFSCSDFVPSFPLLGSSCDE